MADTLGYITDADKAELKTKVKEDYLAIGHLAPSADFHYSQIQVCFHWGFYKPNYFNLQVSLQILIRC